MVNQPIGNHGLESFGVVGFDLGTFLQGQTRIKHAYIWLILVLEVFKNLLIWSDFTFLVDTICIGSPMR